jgi:hypothetical protein
VQYPSDNGVPEPNRLRFGPAPGAADNPFRPTGNVARFELEPYYINGQPDGDVTNTGGYLANRVEVYDRIATRATPAADWPDPVGSTRWYSFSIYIPPDFPEGTPTQWFDFVQWKGLNTGSPPVAMEIRGSQFVLGGKNSDQHLGSIDPGQWTHFVIGLHFSDRPTTGWATAYRDNTRVVNHVPTQTMNDYTASSGATEVDPNYLKMGIYRSVTWTVTQVIYLSRMTIGKTLASVS